MADKLNTEDCPRCGCSMVTPGDVVDVWHCLNCGRRAAPALRRDEYTNLTAIAFTGVTRCAFGAVVHEHRKPAPPDRHEHRKATGR